MLSELSDDQIEHCIAVIEGIEADIEPTSLLSMALIAFREVRRLRERVRELEQNTQEN